MYIIADMEDAMVSGMMEELNRQFRCNNVKYIPCYFHVMQSFVRKLKNEFKLGLKSRKEIL